MRDLPHFDPDEDREGAPPPAVAALRAQVAAGDALLLSTPDYAGALPGSFKNLLERLVGGAEVYGKPVAWVNASGPAAPTATLDAHASLRAVLGYVGTDVVEAECARLPVTRDAIGPDGTVHDDAVRAGLRQAFATLAAHVAAQREVRPRDVPSTRSPLLRARVARTGSP